MCFALFSGVSVFKHLLNVAAFHSLVLLAADQQRDKWFVIVKDSAPDTRFSSVLEARISR